MSLLLRSSLLSVAATMAILLTTSPSNALPSNTAAANSLGLTGRDAIVQEIQDGPAAGGPRFRGPGPSGGPRFNTGPRFSGRQFSGPRVGRQFRGPRISGRQFNQPRFRGNRFAFRRGRFNDGPAFWPYAAATPYLYDYGYNYCERVLEPRLTRRGIVMRWVRRCPGEDYYPYR